MTRRRRKRRSSPEEDGEREEKKKGELEKRAKRTLNQKQINALKKASKKKMEKFKHEATYYKAKPAKHMTAKHINAETVKKMKEKINEKLERVRRDATMLEFLAQKNTEELEGTAGEEKKEEKEVEDIPSGDRVIPPPASSNTEVLDYLTFIKVSHKREQVNMLTK